MTYFCIVVRMKAKGCVSFSEEMYKTLKKKWLPIVIMENIKITGLYLKQFIFFVWLKIILFSLENVACKLSKVAPDSTILCIRPNRMERSTFSCYDNFVSSNFCGAPNHDKSESLFQAARHLQHLLLDLEKKTST